MLEPLQAGSAWRRQLERRRINGLADAIDWSSQAWSWLWTFFEAGPRRGGTFCWDLDDNNVFECGGNIAFAYICHGKACSRKEKDIDMDGGIPRALLEPLQMRTTGEKLESTAPKSDEKDQRLDWKLQLPINIKRRLA